MKWDFVKKLKDPERVHLFEMKVDYVFPSAFKDVVNLYNGGTPENSTFDTEETEENDFNRLLSFNEEDTESIWKILNGKNSWDIEGLDWRYVPFASDSFGNYICFDRTNDHIVFFDHEDCYIEEVASSFTEFMDSLYGTDLDELYKKYFG